MYAGHLNAVANMLFVSTRGSASCFNLLPDTLTRYIMLSTKAYYC